ncbi:hypothetical protein [Paenibacillus sp. FSL H7-0918]|uniref:hypothetical protein n=1 Tax=Paenibacillus sp. FSL H7-0918 TaxID=2921442 RepID=UPI0030FB6C3E
MSTPEEKNNKNIFYTLYCIATIIILFFIFAGTNDTKIINEIVDKMTTINFTLAIGYAALVPALAAISTNNNTGNNSKKEIIDFIKMIVAYVLINIIIVSLTFNNVDYSPLLMRVLISFMIALILLLSQILINLTNKLLN